MKLFSKFPAAALIAGLSLAATAGAQSLVAPEIIELDRIVAVVNDDVIVYSCRSDLPREFVSTTRPSIDRSRISPGKTI